jgi:drug/metabolite transporter (DMT)-like permease
MAGELLAIGASLCFVLSNVIFRKTEHQASPIFINFFRTLIGTVTFILFVLITNTFGLIFQLSWQIWSWVIISFLFGQVIGDTSYFMAQKDLGTTKALAIATTFPIFTFILSMIFLDDLFDWDIIFSFVFIAIGVYLIGKSKNPPKSSTSTQKLAKNNVSSPKNSKAVMWAFLASFGWATGLVIIDWATNEITLVLQVESMSSVIGNVIRFPFAMFSLGGMLLINEGPRTFHKSKATWAWLLLGALIGSTIGVYFFTEAARVAGATFMSLIATANPLFALPLSYLINREKISRLGFLGIVVIILGVLILVI